VTTQKLTQTGGKLEQFVQQAGQLYSLPAVAMEVLQLTSNDQVDVGEIKRCIERDPAMVVKILKVVNSPLFGLSGEVSDLNQALALLGIKPLKLLVLGFSLPKGMLQGIEADALAAYWQFSLTKAVAAREISNKQDARYGDDAFICGLLSEIGALVLLQNLGDAYANFVAKVCEEEADLTIMEIETIGFDHGVLGCRLLQSWKLPDSIVETIRISDPSSGIDDQELTGQVATIRLAHRFAEMLTRNRTQLLPELIETLRLHSECEQEEVEKLAVDIQEKVFQLASVLSVTLPDGSDYQEVVATAYTQLSQVAESIAAPLAIGSRDLVAQSSEAQDLVETLDGFEPAKHVPNDKTTGVSKLSKKEQDRPVSQSPGSAIQPHSIFLSDVAQSIEECRRKRAELSVLLLSIDQFEQFLLVAGPAEVDAFQQFASLVIGPLTDDEAIVHPCGDSALAVALRGHDRHQSVTLVRQIQDIIPTWSQRRPFYGRIGISVSGGVSSTSFPPKGLEPLEMFDSAKRCLLAASRGGGGSVKSIEIL